MIIIKSKQELELMREAGRVTAYILKELEQFMKPGVATIEIDRFVEKTVKEHGMIAAEKGYCGYPASICVSINDEVVHGIPSEDRILQDGDIVSVDLWWNTKGTWLMQPEPSVWEISVMKQSISLRLRSVRSSKASSMPEKVTDCLISPMPFSLS